MSRASVLTWAIALLLGVGLVAASVHARSAQSAACARVGRVLPGAGFVPSQACAQARVQADRTLLMAGAGAIFIVMAAAVVSATRPRAR